ncbi:hypothetical protein JCM11251_004836 [Rhodosporidiobolus azoricus]
MTATLARPRLWSLLLVTFAGAALFARGFFPVKPLLPGYSDAQSYIADAVSSSVGGDAASAPFSRLAFVVVDALRSDFLLGPGSHFSFANSLIASGRALPYTAIAQSPTVTLPRIKALTTGSNPTFLDAILNIAEESLTSAAFENVDSWVRQLVISGDVGAEKRQVVFAGDDTWMRLFPREWFAWSEGVSSFFVSDTVTVDANVTRHLDPLIASQSATRSPSSPPSDWDALILHYLGLDHVGHLGGPSSPLMPPKQREMDEIIKHLYTNLEEKDKADGKRSLLVVVGDHGMTEGGNHGGSSEAETSAALLLASPSFSATFLPNRIEHDSPYKHYEVVQQIDLVPTLSALFDLGIPRNSMGRLIPSALRALRPSAFESALKVNVQQLSAVLESSSSLGASRRLLLEARQGLDDSPGSVPAEQSEAVLLRFLSLAQSLLLSTISTYHLPYLYSGLSLLAVSSLLFLHTLCPFWRFERFGVKLAVGSGFVMYLGSYWASSFVEEEHEVWYFFGATGAVLLMLRPNLDNLDRFLLFLSAVSVRLMRAWSLNGQKNLPNFSLSHLLSTSDTSLTSTLLFTTYTVFLSIYFYTLLRASQTFTRRGLSPSTLLKQALLLAVIATIAVLQVTLGLGMHAFRAGEARAGAVWEEGLVRALGKLEVADGTVIARAGYIVGGAGWALCKITSRRAHEPKLRDVYSTLLILHPLLLLTLLTRTTSLPLLLLFWVQHLTLHRLAKKGVLSPLGVAALTVVAQEAGFFALGGSNSLASVDLSSSYTGLSSYSLPLVSLLTYFSNFSLPILSSLSLHSLLSSAPSSSRQLILTYLTSFYAISLAMMCASANWFREHLFVGTVFAPAVLYRLTWLLWVAVVTNLGLGRLLAG